MSVSLKKGERVALSKDSIVDGISVGLGWDTAKYDDDGDFIFYNNLEHPSGGVIHSGDNLTGSGDGDDEVIKVILEKLPKYAERIVFCATIFEAERRMQNFGMVDNSYIRVINNKNGKEIARYDLKEKFGNSTAIIAGEIYRDGNDWKFHAIGEGVVRGLEELCEKFGIEVA